MPATPQSPRLGPASSGTGTAAAGIAVALLAIVCCAGPTLLAAGALGALGGLLGNPWVVAVLVAAVTAVVRRRRAGQAACCPPTESPETAIEQDHNPAPAGDQGSRSQ